MGSRKTAARGELFSLPKLSNYGGMGMNYSDRDYDFTRDLRPKTFFSSKRNLIVFFISLSLLLVGGGVYAKQTILKTSKPTQPSSKVTSDPTASSPDNSYSQAILSNTKADDSQPTSATTPTNHNNTSSSNKPPVNSTPSDTKTYTNVMGVQVEAPDSNPYGATAQCNDGLYSHSQDPQGTCSSHGGVKPPAPTCNQSLKETYKAQYDSAVVQENTRNQNAIASIQAQYSQQLGGNGSGLELNAINIENQNHQQKLTDLLNQYNASLAQINCV